METTLSSQQIAKVLHGITIPPQPQVLVDIQMEQVMPNPDVRRIADLISRDPSLSGTMLKVVNSAHFALKNKISSIHQAVQILGLSTVLNILNGISIKSEMDDATIVQMNRFWDTTMDIANISAALAKQLGLRGADESYALGLFHNCGVPLLLTRFPNYLEVLNASYLVHDERIIDVENRMLNTNHAVVGYFVAKSWHLPDNLCEIIAEHHNVDAIFIANSPYTSEKKTLLAILKIAEHLCRNFNILAEQDLDYEWEKIEVPLLTYMGLSSDDLENIRDDFIEKGQLTP